MAKSFTTREENYSQWYNDIVKKADLAENSSVRGCMVIKPYGYAIWEKVQSTLDRMFKETGHTNAYFPIFIPKSFFSREASHVEGFAKECAVVTHYRLKNDPNGAGVVGDTGAIVSEFETIDIIDTKKENGLPVHIAKKLPEHPVDCRGTHSFDKVCHLQ